MIPVFVMRMVISIMPVSWTITICTGRLEMQQDRAPGKIRPGSILVQDGEVYFTNQDDEYGKIYRMKTDGSQMENCAKTGREVRIGCVKKGAEYS